MPHSGGSRHYRVFYTWNAGQVLGMDNQYMQSGGLQNVAYPFQQIMFAVWLE
jgi:hypothetical protein